MITEGVIATLEQNLELMTEFPIDFRNRTLYAEKQLKLMEERNTG